jgi:hypothetical protein
MKLEAPGDQWSPGAFFRGTVHSPSAEELIEQLFTVDAELLGYIGENPRQRAAAKGA